MSRDLIVMGGSAGGIGVLRRVLRELPADLPAAVMVVIHQAQRSEGGLPRVLRGPLPARYPADGETIELGTVYVAPPDHHLMVEPAGRVRLSRGPKQNRFRPAIDPLFRTAARVFGPQVIGVVLSGYLDDGTFGLMQVKRFGGVTICQEPGDAEAPDMPASAIRQVRPDFVLTADEMAGALARLVRDPAWGPQREAPPTSARPAPTNSAGVPGEAGDIADRGDNALSTHAMPGTPTSLTCPQCGGAIWESGDGGVPIFRCHVGHAYSVESMMAEQNSELEQTLWAALRMFQENAALYRRMAERAAGSEPEQAGGYLQRAREGEARTELIRKILLGEGEAGGEAGERRSA